MDFNNLGEEEEQEGPNLFGFGENKDEPQEDTNFFGFGGNNKDEDDLNNLIDPFSKFSFARSNREPSYIFCQNYEAQTINKVYFDHLNEYQLTSKVGSGSFAKVVEVLRNYYEEDGVTLGKARYAMKVIKKSQKVRSVVDEFGESQLKSESDILQQELELYKKLNNPHICKLYQIIDSPDEDSVYLVIELCDKGQILNLTKGTNQYTPNVELEQFITEQYNIKNTPLKRENIAKVVFQQICQAIKYLHDIRIVNRDIKIDNVLAKSFECMIDEHIKLIDFSTAIQLKSSKQRLFFSAGTPAYMSPENIVLPSEGINGFAADVWSLGVSLFAFVNLQLPFNGQNEDELFNNIKQKELPIIQGNSHELQNLLKRMCSKDQNARPSIDEIMKDSWFV